MKIDPQMQKMCTIYIEIDIIYCERNKLIKIK